MLILKSKCTLVIINIISAIIIYYYSSMVLAIKYSLSLEIDYKFFNPLLKYSSSYSLTETNDGRDRPFLGCSACCTEYTCHDQERRQKIRYLSSSL